VDGDGVAFVEVERESRLPMDQVSDIRISERDVGKSLLLGAGAAIFGVWLKGVLVDEEEPAPTYSGKPPQ
ncbi:MAG: hypothetical protein V1774_05245, partial [Candidatus Eisenbacteria bacterium]